MRYTIENNRLRLVIESRGAQLLHIQSREVTLRSRKSGHGVRLTFPQMTYLGLRHRPKPRRPTFVSSPGPVFLPGRMWRRTWAAKAT